MSRGSTDSHYNVRLAGCHAGNTLVLILHFSQVSQPHHHQIPAQRTESLESHDSRAQVSEECDGIVTFVVFCLDL